MSQISNNLSDFIKNSIAVRQPNGNWLVYPDSKHPKDNPYICEGNTEFEAKELAFLCIQQSLNDDDCDIY